MFAGQRTARVWHAGQEQLTPDNYCNKLDPLFIQIEYTNSKFNKFYIL